MAFTEVSWASSSVLKAWMPLLTSNSVPLCSIQIPEYQPLTMFVFTTQVSQDKTHRLIVFPWYMVSVGQVGPDQRVNIHCEQQVSSQRKGKLPTSGQASRFILP